MGKVRLQYKHFRMNDDEKIKWHGCVEIMKLKLANNKVFVHPKTMVNEADYL